MAHLLLIEDEPQMSQMYTYIFTARGHEVMVFADGDAALAHLREASQKPDGVLLDVLLPKKNGLDVLREIKSDRECAQVIVIMLTNWSGDEYQRQATACGASAYLVKSEMSPRQIAEATETVLSEARVAQPALSTFAVGA